MAVVFHHSGITHLDLNLLHSLPGDFCLLLNLEETIIHSLEQKASRVPTSSHKTMSSSDSSLKRMLIARTVILMVGSLF